MFTKKHMRFLFCVISGSIMLSGCFDQGLDPESSSGGAKLFVAESDFISGYLEWMSVESRKMSSVGLSIHSDAVVKTFSGYLYVIERYGADNVLKLDPSKSGQSSIKYQKHIGDNWNPQDMEFLSDTKAYIANMNEPKITIFNPSKGSIVGHIDISNYTFEPDSNTSPYANGLQLVGSDLYVLLQRRNGFNPGASTLILKINTATDKVIDSISLTFENGYAMTYADDALYITSPGNAYLIGDGGIEKVDLSTKTVSTIIDENKLGGNPNHIVHKDGTRFYVTSYVEWKKVKVVELDAATGIVVATLPGVKDAYGGIFYDDLDRKLYVCESDSASMGIRIFQDNKQIGSSVKSSGSLPPTSIVVVR